MQLRAGETTVTLGGTKRRAPLARLAVEAGHAVSADRPQDDVWGSGDGLRRLVGAHALRFQPPGYVLDIDPENVDLLAFEQAVRLPPRNGDPAVVVAVLGAAVARAHRAGDAVPVAVAAERPGNAARPESTVPARDEARAAEVASDFRWVHERRAPFAPHQPCSADH